MLNIQKNIEGNKLTVALSGRLDTTTAPELEACLRESLDGVSELELDMSGLEYISSAGLRVLLFAQKQMMQKGGMKLTKVCEDVMEVFEVTGFLDILTVE